MDERAARGDVVARLELDPGASSRVERAIGSSGNA